MKYCFGVDIGGTTVKLGLFTTEGEIVDKWEIKTRTENQGEAVLPDIAAALNEKLEEKQIPKDEVEGIGVGVPAPVDSEGVVQNTANLGWGYKEVKREMEELSGMKAEIGNDANVAALGEMWLGAGKGRKNIIMVTLGTGVGGGIIIDGKPLVGAHGAGGEIGHLCVIYVLRGQEVSAKTVFDAVKADDEVAKEIAEEFGKYLGHAMANLAAVADPSAIVIGGGVSKAGEVLLQYVEKNFKEKAFFANKDTEFVLATLGNDAGICGAAKLIL